MNLLFLTLVGFNSIQERNLYTDLLREFAKNGHRVYAVSPAEKRTHVETHIIEEENATILRLRTGNTQKTNIISKGISTIMIEPAFRRAVDRYFPGVVFDLVLYSTPPITLVSAVRRVKKRDGAATYLLLKDIFPQNAVDIGMMSRSGLKGLVYRHFRRKEKRLYAVSDRIGCMSEANVRYLLEHNPGIDPSTVEVCPNSIDVIDKSVGPDGRSAIRKKYGIPEHKKVFVYGGNLGRPQGIPFLIECLRKCRDIEDAFFLIVGSGTEYHLIEDFVTKEKPDNVRLMERLPKEDYDSMVGACDVGLIFLDHRFTIPNFPCRMLAYMQAKLPVIAATDPNTDIGPVIEEGGFGWRCESNDSDGFVAAVKKALASDRAAAAENGFEYLREHYSVKQSYDTIMKSFGK